MQMIMLYFDPKGEMILNNTTFSNSAAMKNLKVCTTEQERIRQLEEKLETLRRASADMSTVNHVVSVPLICQCVVASNPYK